MENSDTSDWIARPPGAGGPAFDVFVSKLTRPQVRPGSIRRSTLLERLATASRCPIVSISAPAGYGKTTLVSQWAERDSQPFAWVSVDEADNDPKVLLSYLAEALNAVEPIGRRVFDTLASPVTSVAGSVVPRLGSAFASMSTPVVLVLDDVHLLHNRECRAAVSVLAEHVPDGARLVLVGRGEPPVRAARLRAEGRIVEIGLDDLSLTPAEAGTLLRDAGVELGEKDVAELHRRTEGWPAGLYLAALYLREDGVRSPATGTFGGDDRLVSEYVEAEFLTRVSSTEREFLTRTAVLERMCGSLCDAVLELPGSATALADLAGSNMLLVPLDRRGQWYRYHHLFRDMLLAELERHEPELVPVLRRRAAEWHLRQGLPETALEYFMSAGDVDAAASLVARLWVPTDRQGRDSTCQRWFRWLDDRGAMERHPLVAVQAGLVAATLGRPVEAERWADAVDRWQYKDPSRPAEPETEAWAGVLRACLCRRGFELMRADADEAARRCAEQNIVAPASVLLQGFARILYGDLDGADMLLEDAAMGAESVASHAVLAIALCERSLVAMGRGEWERARALAEQARSGLRRAGIEENYATPLVCAVLARVALRRGDVPTARRELVHAQRLRPLLTYALPYLSVQVQIELARVHLALDDLAGARTLVTEIDDVLRRRPDLGTLADEARELRAQLATERRPSVPGASTLTTAELRLLPLLSTHLSFREIAAELFLSPHTVKSQAMSIYRKLGASSRSQAVILSRTALLQE